MDTQNGPTPQQHGFSVTTILAILSVVLAAGWITFAYYKASFPDSSRILLLHPIVPIFLLVLLARIYRWVDLKSIVIIEVLMIVLWMFIRLLGVLTPFILGFGFAYIFRFLWNALPFKARYLRGIATVLIVLVCGGLIFYTGKQVSRQAGQMGSGLFRFYYEAVLPYVVGETFEAVAVRIEPAAEPMSETAQDTPLKQPAKPNETFYIGTNHGVYETQGRLNRTFGRTGITNGPLLGKFIHALAAGEDVLYAGTQSGLYRYYKTVPVPPDTAPDAEGENRKRLAPEHWYKVEGTPFDATAVHAIGLPTWNRNEIYIGTANGLYKSQDVGRTWREVAPALYAERRIVSIAAVVDVNGDRTVYVASRPGTGSPLPDGSDSAAEVPQTAETATVHRYLEGSSLAWSPLPVLGHPITALAGPVPTAVRDTAQSAGVELYAGTTDGLYEWHRLGTWRKTEGTPAVSLLASVPSGLYIGDTTALRHRVAPGTGWQPFAVRDDGLSYTYRNEPIVEEAKAYLTQRLPSIAQTGSEAIREGFQFAGSIAFGFGGFLATLSLAFIVFVYASQSFDNYFRSFMTFVPEPHRETVKTYLREIDRNLQQFLKGQVAVIAIISVVSCIIYSVIGVPFALVIGLLAGFCNAIPTFGPFIGGGFAFVAMLMGLAAGDFSLVDFLIRSAFVLVAILGIQTLDNSLISPKIMSSAVDVDPLLIMFAVIVGAAVLGFWGVLLAIPIIVVIKSVIAVSQSLASDSRLAAEEEH